jgi:hypothetical protein
VEAVTDVAAVIKEALPLPRHPDTLHLPVIPQKKTRHPDMLLVGISTQPIQPNSFRSRTRAIRDDDHSLNKKPTQNNRSAFCKLTNVLISRAPFPPEKAGSLEQKRLLHLRERFARITDACCFEAVEVDTTCNISCVPIYRFVASRFNTINKSLHNLTKRVINN